MERVRQIIGICGAAGSGKDAVAAVLTERGFQKRSFAEALRREVRRALTVPEYRKSIWYAMPDVTRGWLCECQAVDDLDPWAKPTSTPMRGLLQTFGTEFRRAQDPDYWVKRESESLPPSGRFVYTDVRFWNEYDMIRRLSGIVWRVERPGVPGNGHISETFWPHFAADVVIRNDGTVDDLKHFVLNLCAAEPSSSPNSAESPTVSATGS
jgi:hypothetical protein